MMFGKEPLRDSWGEPRFENPLPKLTKKVRRLISLVLFMIVGAILLSMSWYTVSEQENAVVTTAGKVTSVQDAGPYFRIPLLQSVTKVDMTTKGMELGYTTVEGSNEYVDTSNTPFDARDNLMISNDFNIVSVDFYAEWQVTDPVKFLYSTENPIGLLNNIIQSNARDVISAYKVDSVLTDGKSEIQAKIRERVSVTLDAYDAGFKVTNIIIQDAEPPTAEVIAAFKAVEDAKQQKDTLLNEANRYYNENIPGARAEADRIVKAAEAAKEARINEANGQVVRFNQMFSEYIINPEITKTRMYLEAMETILPDLRVFIDGTDNDGLLKILNLDKQEVR